MLILALALLLSGCQVPVNDPVETSTQAETEATAAPVETTVPEETTAPDTLSIKDCLLDDRQPLSYEEFFAEDKSFYIPYAENDLRYGWLYPYEDTWILCGINRDENGNIIVESEAFDEVYTVPCKQDLSDYRYFAADGKFAYLQDKASTTIIQLELRTGKVETLVTEEKLLQVYSCAGDLLYYAAVEGEKITINRLYIPTMQNDCLYDDISADIPYGDTLGFLYSRPSSTQSDVVWQTINPEMMTLLKKELSNPDSPYRSDEYAASAWEREDPLSEAYFLIRLMQLLQEDTGVLALLECTYKLTDGIYTERLGILDNCYNGTNWGHDHFAWDMAQPPFPESAIGEWMALPNVEQLSELEAKQMYNDNSIYDPQYRLIDYAVPLEPCRLYIIEKGKMHLITDMYIQKYLQTNYYIFVVTDNNVLVQINPETGEGRALYRYQSNPHWAMGYDSGMLFIKDGDTVIQIDVPAAKYRVLIQHTGIRSFQLATDYAVPDMFFFVVEQGLFIEPYFLNLQTGEVTIARNYGLAF